MPFDAKGRFRPPPFPPLTGPLFDVIPPDDPSDPVPATPDDHEWYRQLVEATADLLVYVVAEVNFNYTHWRGVAFKQAQVAGMHALAERVVALLGDDLRTYKVAKDVNRLAKQVRLVVYSTERGKRRNWPMASRLITRQEAEEIVRAAFWGKWLTEPSSAARPAYQHARKETN